ncbi:PBSX family phage terminase large subunit [Elizabethkingia anophelis]|nr:PBSX family phage terminase large subunit [Elizabethkingia anophelis]MCT4104509.1 PBSX family phage terminase large subunit [Elizabethkingia anophelis]
MAIKTQTAYDALYEDKEKFIILMTGGRGSAKSFNATTFIERLSFEKGHKMLFSRYTMTSAKISIIPEFEEKIELEGTREYFIINNNEIINKFSGSQILFRGIKTSSGNQTANLKSIQGITAFIGDEMEEWESEDDYDKLVLSIRQKGIQLRVILILNPTDADHFIYKKYIENNHRIVQIDGVDVQMSTHPDVLHLHTTYLDNIENLSEQFITIVESIKKESIDQCTVNGVLNQAMFNKSKYAQKIIGRWADVAEGVIFDNVEEGEFDTSIPYCFGQDYGFSIDPDTLIKVAVDHKRKIIYLDEKYYGVNKLSTDDLFALNKAHIEKPKDLIAGDSSEPRLIEDLRKKGLNIKPTEKSPGIVTASILKMLEYKIIVTPDSHNLKKELRNYAWSDKKAGIPIDKYNHAIDAARYGFLELVEPINNNLKRIASLI